MTRCHDTIVREFDTLPLAAQYTYFGPQQAPPPHTKMKASCALKMRCHAFLHAKLETPSIDLGTSRMQSERSSI